MTDPYRTPAGVEAAIKRAAQEAARDDPSLDAGRRIQLEYFHRFLSRVFSEGSDSEWVLKGGPSILARVPASRATRDIDLFLSGLTLEDALRDLVRLASTDLGDHFRFEYAYRSAFMGTDTQPYTDGYRVTFHVYVGASAKGALHVDLALGTPPSGDIVVTQPATALKLPRLSSSPYRLYPVVDQIADKVCATLNEYNGHPSSREKDLVDLVIFALTQNIDGTGLVRAITTETGRRRMAPVSHFAVPASWGPGYARLARSVPHCERYRTVKLATPLVTRLVDPALSGEVCTKIWRHESLLWS